MLEPEIGVRQNMIYVPPQPPGGISEVAAAPFRGCMAVIAFFLLGIGYCGYKVAHWTHEMSVDRWISHADAVLATKPFAVVIRGTLKHDYQRVKKFLNSAEHQTIAPNHQDGLVEQEEVTTGTRWVFKGVNGDFLVMFQGADSLNAASRWLEVNGFYHGDYDPANVNVGIADRGPATGEIGPGIEFHRNSSDNEKEYVSVICWYRYNGKLYYDFNGKYFGEPSESSEQLPNFSIKQN